MGEISYLIRKMIQSHIVKIVLGLIKKSFILEGEICWPDFVTLPSLSWGITKEPQGDFKPKQATPQDKSLYVHPLLVEFSTGRKFLRSGVLFTRNHANPTKIWTFSCSKIRKLNSRSNFWLVRSKIWTARCKHRDRINFSTAKAWLCGYSAGKKITKRVYE